MWGFQKAPSSSIQTDTTCFWYRNRELDHRNCTFTRRTFQWRIRPSPKIFIERLLVYALRIVISVAISSFSGPRAGTKACSAYGDLAQLTVQVTVLTSNSTLRLL